MASSTMTIALCATLSSKVGRPSGLREPAPSPLGMYTRDRRRLITTRLDALQEVRKVGLQVLRILCCRHTVGSGSTILAGEPVGFPHPLQIEDVVQRGQCHPAFCSCQFSYPLPFRGQVCKTQSSLPC